MLIECDADAFAASADGDARIDLFIFYATGQSMSEVRVVAALLCVGSVVVKLKTFSIEIFLDVLFECKASVVAGDSYYLYIPNLNYEL